eukprot:5356898-Amphidinium_carterae.1
MSSVVRQMVPPAEMSICESHQRTITYLNIQLIAGKCFWSTLGFEGAGCEPTKPPESPTTKCSRIRVCSKSPRSQCRHTVPNDSAHPSFSVTEVSEVALHGCATLSFWVASEGEEAEVLLPRGCHFIVDRAQTQLMPARACAVHLPHMHPSH